MFNLPRNTLVNKPLYKKTVFEKFNLKVAERNHFDADVGRMSIISQISQKSVPALGSGKDVTDIYVLLIQLKQKDFDVKNILLLQKLIPQHIIYALQYEDQTQFCIFHTRLQQTEWQPTDDATIMLEGSNLDAVWNNIVARIGNLDASSDDTLEQQILKREQRNKLLLQIESLEKRCRAENQTRKKYELHQQLMKLKEKLNTL